MQTDLIAARVADLQNAVLKGGAPKFLGFLSLEETEFVKRIFKNGVEFSYFGGHLCAERLFLCVHNKDYCIKDSAYPIDALTVMFRRGDTLTHRDFLGALMSKGIKRETVGDILVEEGRAVLFVSRDVSKYILEQVKLIGRVGVKIERGFCEPLPAASQKVMQSHTVASLRLDCVVAALIGVSRDKSVKFITEGLVAINSAVAEKTTKTVVVNDKISVRGYGKFTVISVDGVTRKGRTVLVTERYK